MTEETRPLTLSQSRKQRVEKRLNISMGYLPTPLLITYFIDQEDRSRGG
jgi:hypothetical protein